MNKEAIFSDGSNLFVRPWEPEKGQPVTIRVRVSEDVEAGEMLSVHHHGRCDVGSAWATGKVKNEECVDVPPLEEE